MLTPSRLRLERQVLAAKLAPNLYHFCDVSTDAPYIVFAARTNRGNLYTLRVELEDFPEDVPKVFVQGRMLRDRDGNPLDDASANMHTLPSEHGWTRLCHYGYDSWTPMVSLYKIFVKARLWLEMYEEHLKTGRDIDYYLAHQA
ncbi:MAG: hypothetical protein IK066_05980 [Kiritimatiellae bacterium]|nr:hypothetical protein [Kiritimatiellia bacterium]